MRERQMRRALATVSVFLLAGAVLIGQQPGGRGGRGRAAGAAPGAPNEGRGQGGASLRIERDLEYGRAAAQPLTLDVYRMDPSSSPSPLIVWIHGMDGALTTKMSTPAIAFVSASSGYAVA